MKTTASRTSLTAIAVLVAILAVTMSGCGGGGDAITPVTPPAGVPAIHDGYAVYLQGGSYDSSYLPQDTPDHFKVAPGAYKIVALKQSEVGTMSDGTVNTMGGITWPATVYKHATSEVVSPTTSGWVFGPGTYDADVYTPSGTIRVTIEVTSANLDGYTVHMVAVDPAGKAYPKDADGHYQVEVWQPFKWSAIWMKDGAVVADPTKYDPSTSCIAGSGDIGYDNGYQVGKVVSRVAFAVYVYDNTVPQGDGGVTVDTTFIDFTPEVTVRPEPGNG